MVYIPGKVKHFNKYKIKDDGSCEFYIFNKRGKFTIFIDLDDLYRLIEYDRCWYICGTENFRHVRTNIYKNMENGKCKLVETQYLHRWISGAEGKCCVDHINHNSFDNRKCNLRITVDKYNLKNRKSKNPSNKSGYRNVSWNKSWKKWVVSIRINGKATTVGHFNDVHEAGKYAEQMRQKYYGEFAGAS